MSDKKLTLTDKVLQLFPCFGPVFLFSAMRKGEPTIFDKMPVLDVSKPVTYLNSNGGRYMMKQQMPAILYSIYQSSTIVAAVYGLAKLINH